MHHASSHYHIKAGVPFSNEVRRRVLNQLTSRNPHVVGAIMYASRVKPGWIPLFDKFCQRLSHLIRQAGDNTGCEVSTMEELECGLAVCMRNETRAVSGLVRKFLVQTRFTCMRCGVPGKPRVIDGKKKRTLCATCASPFLLRDTLGELGELKVKENLSGTPPFVERQRVPVALRGPFDAFSSQCQLAKTETGKVLGIYPWDFTVWLNSLGPLQRTTARLVKERMAEID